MRGDSVVIARGNIGNIYYSETSKSEPIVSFLLCIERNAFDCTWIKCHAYDRPAIYLKKSLRKGDYVIVNGELINKNTKTGDSKEIDLKVFKVDIIKMGNKGNEHDTNEEF